jgi:hypothetical protein
MLGAITKLEQLWAHSQVSAVHCADQCRLVFPAWHCSGGPRVAAPARHRHRCSAHWPTESRSHAASSAIAGVALPPCADAYSRWMRCSFRRSSRTFQPVQLRMGRASGRYRSTTARCRARNNCRRHSRAKRRCRAASFRRR